MREVADVNKLDIINAYAWPIGSSGFEGLFTIVSNDRNTIQLTNSMKKGEKYDEIIFSTKNGKTSKAINLYIIERIDNYKKTNATEYNGNSQDRDYIMFRFRCKRFLENI